MRRFTEGKLLVATHNAGKLEEMRSMIPSRRKRTRRVKKLPAEPIHDVPPAAT